MKYENYIFDLYGTLVDIRTDEEKSELWEKLALFYGYYDAHYTPEELKKRYRELVSGKEKELKEQILKKETVEAKAENTSAAGAALKRKEDDVHEAHPEIKIEYVFQKLFEEKGVKADLTLAVHAGQFFRILSTEYVRLYDGVVELLSTIKKAGKPIYLLSNAQRIFTEYEMHTLGIAEYFDDILISSECSVKKPDERFYKILLDRHPMKLEDSIMIGNDANSDIAGAKGVGLHTFYIHSNISPKLPEIEVKDEKGKKKTVLQMPEADIVLEEMDMKKVLELLQ